ncbi:MAG: HD domain-containing phosphohydrolase [Gemmataceae bacterium]
MTDTRELLNRITAFRQRLGDVTPAPNVAEPDDFRRSVLSLAGADAADPLPPQLTQRARELLGFAKTLLDRQRAFTADPVVAGLAAASSNDALIAYHRETTAMMASAVRMAQSFPESPSVQLKMCNGLEGVLEVVKERLTVQERALALRRTDYSRIDRVAACLTAMNRFQQVNLNVLATLAEELIEDARQGKPLRVLHADVLSSASYPGGVELPAPARFVAAHALTVAQVVARVVHLDYEWASRPLPAVVAALVMDAGMLRVRVDLLARAGKLTPAERRELEQHAQYSAELIVRYLPDAAPLAAAVACHHERADGTGYPAGLKGAAIPSLGRLLAAADVYAACCAPRPYRPAGDTRTALTDVLLAAEGGQLDKDFAEYLVALAFYPVGAVVELTDGRVGVVAANHPDRLDPRAPGRPVVAVLADADGALLPRPEHVDLSASARGGILRTLPAGRRRDLLGARYPDLV